MAEVKNVAHVLPLGDLIEHDPAVGDACPCKPTVEPRIGKSGRLGWMVLHHPMDGQMNREAGWRSVAPRRARRDAPPC